MIEIFDAPIARSFSTDGEHKSEDEIRPSPLILPLYFHPLAPGQEQMRILLISSPTWVKETIHDLHARRFADTNDWSSLVPGCQSRRSCEHSHPAATTIVKRNWAIATACALARIDPYDSGTTLILPRQVRTRSPSSSS